MSETQLHILVIDDDPTILEMMREVLQREGGYRVTTTDMAFEDLAEIEKLQPQLIVLDFVLQRRQTSWTFLQKLRLHRPTKDISVIICTAGLSDAKEQESVLRQKGIPLLYKPFDIDELLDTVKQMLSSARPRPS